MISGDIALWLRELESDEKIPAEYHRPGSLEVWANVSRHGEHRNMNIIFEARYPTRDIPSVQLLLDQLPSHMIFRLQLVLPGNIYYFPTARKSYSRGPIRSSQRFRPASSSRLSLPWPPTLPLQHISIHLRARNSAQDHKHPWALHTLVRWSGKARLISTVPVLCASMSHAHASLWDGKGGCVENTHSWEAWRSTNYRATTPILELWLVLSAQDWLAGRLHQKGAVFFNVTWCKRCSRGICRVRTAPPTLMEGRGTGGRAWGRGGQYHMAHDVRFILSKYMHFCILLSACLLLTAHDRPNSGMSFKVPAGTWTIASQPTHTISPF